MSTKTFTYCDRCGKSDGDAGIRHVFKGIKVECDGNSEHIDACEDCRRVLNTRIQGMLEDWKKGRPT